MGWVLLFLLLVAALLVLWLLRIRGGALTAAAAALLLGSAGYAWQGRPTMAGAPTRGSSSDAVIPLAEARHAFYERFTAAESWLVMAEALERKGRTGDAAALLQNAVRRNPGDSQLWVGLGNALVDHSRGLTPPAELAFRRAGALDPRHPAPAFFYGLALARSGDPAEAKAIWQELLDRNPGEARWKPLVEGGIAALGSGTPQAPAGK